MKSKYYAKISPVHTNYRHGPYGCWTNKNIHESIYLTCNVIKKVSPIYSHSDRQWNKKDSHD